MNARWLVGLVGWNRGKEKVQIYHSVIFVVLICLCADAATITQKESAIEAGLEHLARQQQGDGRWRYNGNAYQDCAATGAALKTFQLVGYSAGSDVIINGTNYGDVVGRGLGYVFSMGQQVPISHQMHGNPDTNGNGIGVRFGASQDNMISGAVIPAIIATGTPDAIVTSGPLAGKSYFEVVQDTVDYFAYGQVEGRGPYDGGWRYSANYGSSDQSSSPWPVLGMISARNWDIEAPSWVETELDKYMLNIQNPADGGAWYMYNGSLGTNIYRTASFVSQAFYTDDPVEAQNVQSALAFLNSRWQTTANSTFNGNFANPGAMWATFIALSDIVGMDDTEAITNLRLFDPGTMELDPGVIWNWSEDYAEYLVDMQNANGSWNPYAYWSGTFPTSWGVEMLVASVPEPATLSLLAVGGLALIRRRK